MARLKSVMEMEEYFNSGRFADTPEDSRWMLLTTDEVAIIAEELKRCQDSFLHAASNWFWISEKSGRPVPLELWEGQRIVYEKMQDMAKRGKPQYVIVIKSRQLGLSQFGTALACHKCFFTANQNALIISEDDEKTRRLWNDYTLPIYRNLPWFLKPQHSSLTIEKGMILDTDPKKSSQPGLRSNIRIVSANSSGYVGQGMRLNMFHGSEFTSWPSFNDVIERGIDNALFDDPTSIGILESTAKGSGTQTHSFWNRMMRLGDGARWEPVFLPFFMDKTHVLAPPSGWARTEKEEKRREMVREAWVKCDNSNCGKYFNRIWSFKDMTGSGCRFCKTGKFQPYTITDQQLYWMSAREHGASDPRIIKQEQAVTAEEAFQVFGDQVFSDSAIEYASYTAEKSAGQIPIMGFFDPNGIFHGFRESDFDRKCCAVGCTQDHRKDDRSYMVWDQPTPNSEYYIGADISEGIKKDYTVFFVIKKGNGGADLHVATYRNRDVNPYNAAYKLNPLGRYYNNAQIAVEYTGPGSTTANTLLNNIGYPNVYKRKTGAGDYSRSQGNGYHWLTNAISKNNIISYMERWLTDELLIVRDFKLVEELKTFVRQEEGKAKTGASENQKGAEFHDDYLMAAMICLYTAHQMDFDENGGVQPFKIDPTPENQPYVVTCSSCNTRVGVSDPQMYKRCVRCNSMHLAAVRNLAIAMQPQQNPYKDIVTGILDPFEGSTFGPDMNDQPYVGYF